MRRHTRCAGRSTHAVHTDLAFTERGARGATARALQQPLAVGPGAPRGQRVRTRLAAVLPAEPPRGAHGQHAAAAHAGEVPVRSRLDGRAQGIPSGKELQVPEVTVLQFR